MQIEVRGQTGGGIQFIVHAETDAERVVMRSFEQQVRENRFWLHGFTTDCDGKMLGPAHFNFGTTSKEIK